MISIVIPSVRSNTINDTIAAIVAQTDRDWELIVSDQSGNDSLIAHIEKWGDSRIQRVCCPGRGASMARNFGILHTQSDLIAFTDDDCCPRPNWIATIRSLFAEEPDLWMATGSIVPPPVMPPPPCVCPGHVPEERRARPSEGKAIIYSVTANAIYRREAFEKAGPFDICLSPGTEFYGGEEADHGTRMDLFDPVLLQTPRLEVEHTHGVRVGAKAAWNIKRNYAVSIGGVAGKQEQLKGMRTGGLKVAWQNALADAGRRSPQEAIRAIVRATYIYQGYRRLMEGYTVDRRLQLLVPHGKNLQDLYKPIAPLLNYQLPDAPPKKREPSR